MRRVLVLAICLVVLPVAGVAAPPAGAAREASMREARSLLKAVASSPQGRQAGLSLTRRGRLRAGRLTFRHRAFRSSVSTGWARVEARCVAPAVPSPVAPRQSASCVLTALLKRRGRRWTVALLAEPTDIARAMCRRRAPATAVAHDLDVAVINDWALGDQARADGVRCRHPRDLAELQDEMTSQELSSAVALARDGAVELPRADERTGRCAWPGDPAHDQPGVQLDQPPTTGRVARADRRWGVLNLTKCPGGVDAIWETEYASERPMQALVSRDGTSGPFTRLHAIVLVAPWSTAVGMRDDGACARDRNWPVPDGARVALGFCAPFPRSLGVLDDGW